jgi:hypothetical protein
MDLDPSTGAYYDNARWYNSANGGFFNRDPIAGDINLYRYCSNDPLVQTDASGLEPAPPDINSHLTYDQVQKLMADNLAKVKKQYVDGQKEPSCPSGDWLEWETKTQWTPGYAGGVSTLVDVEHCQTLHFVLDSEKIARWVTAPEGGLEVDGPWGTSLKIKGSAEYYVSGEVQVIQSIEVCYKQWHCCHCENGVTTCGGWNKYYTVTDKGFRKVWKDLKLIYGGSEFTPTGGTILGIGFNAD